MKYSHYSAFFHRALKAHPYDYQIRLADSPVINRAIRVPTGAGKTAAAVLAWLWKWKTAPETTPRRLVYMLPMRVLVEQTFKNIDTWLTSLDINDVKLSMLMGGEVEQECVWETQPEHPYIFVGTQDMLLSRALNRGYAMSRYQWPVHFGYLNNDALFVCDEVQLMSSGLATSLQLQAWRKQMGCAGQCVTWWMSATLNPEWLQTVDHPAADLEMIELGPTDRLQMQEQYQAAKPVEKHPPCSESELAALILSQHRSDSLTLAVVNTVERARTVYGEIQKQRKKNKTIPDPLLIHSRFRQHERNEKRSRLDQIATAGGIVLSTQVIEAGVDISSRTLITEMAPWASLVQRFGRCNRRGEFDDARITTVDTARAAPYPPEAVESARTRAAGIDDVALEKLEQMPLPDDRLYTHVIRRKDLLELFDTTPDLSGADIDISRFLREGEDRDSYVYWRDFEGEPTEAERRPARSELCPVPADSLEDFAKSKDLFRYDMLDEKWRSMKSVFPGQIYLLRASGGGYSSSGWDPKSTELVHALSPEPIDAADAYSRDRYSSGPLRSIANHTDNVCKELEEIIGNLPLRDCELSALRVAARWHDRGKGHAVFQEALPDGIPKGSWAKAPGKFRRYSRPGFRHELGSALAVLPTENHLVSDELRDLIAYLCAAHHGKVRLSIRSMPNEKRPEDSALPFARGIHHGDQLPATDLGDGVLAPLVKLNLDCMRIGLSESGDPSWSERILSLRDDPNFGPFRLAYLEAILRSADRRASAKEGDEHA